MNKINSFFQYQADTLKSSYKSDSISGFLVFLLALPLCLGISKASGFPPIAGVYTAIIGGIIVSFFSGSPITIKGPAAGLIVIALGAITELGDGDLVSGYKYALAVIVISGAFQVGLGFFKAGVLSNFFPASVIHGLLAAIGVIIFSKQIHFLMGVVPYGKEPLELLEEIPQTFLEINPEVAIIGFVSLAILFIKPLFKQPIVKLIPAPLIVLLFAIPAGLYFDLEHIHDYALGSLHFHIDPAQLLVALPKSILSGITFPDFSKVLSPTSIKYIIMFCLIGSIESLLSAKAIDTLDTKKRKSNFDKDLIAVGIGNMIAGFIGGLPMIAEIVRSSNNLNNGAKTHWANFFHGLFLLLFIVLASPLIQMIPNAALAAMLIFTGYNLAAPREFIHTYKIGAEQLLIFVTTLVITLLTDMLIGVAAGIAIKLTIHLINGIKLKELFKVNLSILNMKGIILIRLKNPAIFTNFIPFTNKLRTIPRNAHIIVDFTYVPLIDHTFMEGLSHIEEEVYDKGGKIEFKGFDKHHYFSDHPLAGRTLVKNPNFHLEAEQLNERQSKLLLYSQKNKLEFDPKRSASVMKFSYSDFIVVRRSRYAENFLLGNRDNFSFLFADLNIQVTQELSLNKTFTKSTIVFLSNIKNVNIPDFTLTKEQAFDFIKELQGNTDIDFEEFPEFSNNYFLSGEDESGIRKFFKPKALKLMEENKNYYIQSMNSRIFIYKEDVLYDLDQYTETIQFIEKFVEAVTEG
ncbi:MAG: SulP family inorganic anion transporter [Cytophagales bacterium]